MADVFVASVVIHATPAAVWNALTIPPCMAHWMGEPEMQIDVVTDWQVGTPIVVRGVHHVPFENNGTVLQFDNARLLRYTHRSSLSRLAEVAENYSILSFSLTPQDDRTKLELTIHNFPTESIQRHLEFYWRTTLTTLKEWIEGPGTSQ